MVVLYIKVMPGRHGCVVYQGHAGVGMVVLYIKVMPG